MAMATGLIYPIISIAPSQDVPFYQPQQPQFLHYGSTKGYLLFSLVLHSFLRYLIGDDLQYVHYGFSTRLGKCRANKGASYAFLCLEC